MKMDFRKYFFTAVIICLAFFIRGQGIGPTIIMDNIVKTTYTIKESDKLNDKPRIEDTVKKIENITYNITSKSTPTTYYPDGIVPAKMVNEPLSKLYHCLIKAGMGNYTMPYGEIFINNLRSKEFVYGFRYKHLSSTATLNNSGFSGFSDNEIYTYGKNFFKKHTLSGDFNYLRNVNHFYGYDFATYNVIDKSFTK
ncbi:MAG: hypothetical protein IAF38_15870, partial [Bacteroidia bacterium]|nr:hypothetical protein [Bacteroidia bacterium]